MNEDIKENNLFYVCSLIEYIARKTLNKKEYIIDKIGKEKIEKIFNLAEVYHCENIEKISDELINEFNITDGNYKLKIIDNRPTYWEMGRVYSRLIKMVSFDNEEKYIDNLICILVSWIIERMDNYESSLYYESPEYIYECYMEGKIL